MDYTNLLDKNELSKIYDDCYQNCYLKCGVLLAKSGTPSARKAIAALYSQLALQTATVELAERHGEHNTSIVQRIVVNVSKHTISLLKTLGDIDYARLQDCSRQFMLAKQLKKVRLETLTLPIERGANVDQKTAMLDLQKIIELVDELARAVLRAIDSTDSPKLPQQNEFDFARAASINLERSSKAKESRKNARAKEKRA